MIGAAHARTRETGHRRAIRAATAAAVGIAMAVAGIMVAMPASAATELLINSVGTEAATGSLKDGICQSTVGTCTLRAALQEANAINGAPGNVKIGVDSGFAGGNILISNTSSAWMYSGTLSSLPGGVAGTNFGDAGAAFSVTAPVTIDFEHKITVTTPVTNDWGMAAFLVNGPNITIQGLNNVFAGESTFYVGPLAKDVLLTDIKSATSNYYPERFVVVRGGAQDIVVSNSTIQGYASADRDWNWGVVDGTSAAFPVKSLTVDSVAYQSNKTGDTGCNGSTAGGCNSTPVDARNQYVTNLTFTNNTVTNTNRIADNDARALDLRGAFIQNLMVDGNTFDAPYYRAGDSLIDMATATMGTFKIVNNRFKDMDGNGGGDTDAAAIMLPTGKTITRGLISGNKFLAVGTMPALAIYWNGAFNDSINLADSHLSIVDNQFNGFSTAGTRGSIRLYRMGLAEVAQNTFGAASNAQTNTVLEEFNTTDASSTVHILSNWTLGSNAKMNTWFPTARNKSNVQAVPVSAVACVVALEVAPPSDPDGRAYASARYPAVSPQAAQLDVYWTASNKAEVYLGRHSVSANTRTTLQVPLPNTPDDQALTANGGVGPVNPTTGAVSGGLRLQTIDPNAIPGGTPASSQFSRVATIGGSCAPALTIAQRSDQNESTMARDRVFRLTTSVALDESTVLASDFNLAGSTAPGARVVSVVKVDDKTWDITVHANDSGTVTVNVAAGAVATSSGLKSRAAAATGSTEATNNVLTFVNPLRVSPTAFVLVTGEPKGKDYSLVVDPAAPVPTADLHFTLKLDKAATAHGVTPDTLTPTITADANKTTVNVTARAGDVRAGTVTVISHTVTSNDVNYDGLVVPSVSPHLFATNPAMSIEKLAYINVTDDSSPEQIQNTGTHVPAGVRLADRTAVWFVFKVSNNSADDWQTTLSGVTVIDDELGVIGSIPAIAVGSSVLLAYRGPIALAANSEVPSDVVQ